MQRCVIFEKSKNQNLFDPLIFFFEHSIEQIKRNLDFNIIIIHFKDFSICRTIQICEHFNFPDYTEWKNAKLCWAKNVGNVLCVFFSFFFPSAFTCCELIFGMHWKDRRCGLWRAWLACLPWYAAYNPYLVSGIQKTEYVVWLDVQCAYIVYWLFLLVLLLLCYLPKRNV